MVEGVTSPVTPSEIKPVSGKVAVEAGTDVPKGAEAKKLAGAVDNLSLITVDVAAGGTVPEGVNDNLNVALFGEKNINKIKDPVVKALASDLNNLLIKVENNLKVHGEANVTTADMDAAIIATIQSNQGWKDAYNLLDNAKQKELVKTIREKGAVSAGRRLLLEKIVISQESGEYAAAQRKQNEIESQLAKKNEEKDILDGQTKGKNKAKAVAEKEAKTSELESLKGKKINLLERRESLERKVDELSNNYREVNPKTGAVKFNKTERDKDPEYKKYNDQLIKIEDKINGTGGEESIDEQIRKANESVLKADKLFQSFERLDVLTTEIGNLGLQLATAEGEVITARTAFTSKLNELMKTFNVVLPEAAKEALNNFKSSIDSANETLAKEKAEEAAKAGDIIKGADANVELYYQFKYVKTEQRVSSRLRDFFKRVGVKETNTVLLRTDLNTVLANDARGAADLLKADVDAAIVAGKGAGLSPEQIQYFKDNPKAYAKFIETAKTTVFKTVVRKAHLENYLTETDMRTLIGSPDFATAAEQAVGDAQKLKDLKGKLAGAGLKGGTWKEIGAKLAKPALWGLLLLILVFLGIKGFGGH